MTETDYEQIACNAALSLIGAAPRRELDAWTVGWDDLPAASAALDELRQADYEFHTSGSTGTPGRWLHHGEVLSANTDALVTLVGREFDAMVSFAPPRHIFGACASVVLPAVLGVPFWFWGAISCRPPATRGGRLLVAAIPWTFPLLHRQLDWLRSFDKVTILHSTAVLPASARELRDDLVGGRTELNLVEALGSTETGGIAYHSGWSKTAPWRLFPGVEFDHTADSGNEGQVLQVTTPWRPRRADGSTPRSWATGDVVDIVDDSQFVLRGRIGRLVKINGKRHDLGHVEEALKAQVACSDVACLVVGDVIRGETFDVLIAGAPEGAEQSVRAVLRRLGLAARQISAVAEIRRSETGKVLADQSQRGNPSRGKTAQSPTF